MIPDYFEAITGYRVFNVFENGLLAGAAFVEPWPPYEPFVARCGAVSREGAGEHVRDGRFVSAPVYGCDCGIHAVKTQAALLERIRMDGFPLPLAVRLQYLRGPVGNAWGAVKMWGRVIEHEDGYRAEFAYPSHLHCDDADLARRVAALYGVPCDYTPLEPPVPTWRPHKRVSLKMGYYKQPLFECQPPRDLGTLAIGVLLLLLLLTLEWPGINSHQPAPASKVRIGMRDPATIAESSASIERDRQTLGAPGVPIGLVQDGMVLFTRGVVLKEVSGTTRPDPDTLSPSRPTRRR